MIECLAIDFVAAPFAGHLYPQLNLARDLHGRGFDNIRFLNTPHAREAVVQSVFDFEPLLADVSDSVFAIANTKQRVGSNPQRLLSQLRSNLDLMDQLRDELRSNWQRRTPDLVIADLTVPVAGLLAQSMGIRWWTSLPTICVLDTPDGIPAYMGGWTPNSRFGLSFRNAIGRTVTRCFKQSVHRMFRRRMKALGIDQIYRVDGYETIYSPDTILGFGIRELEFPATWPAALQFVGPMTASPSIPHTAPQFVDGKPHVLVSLGTHLGWAKPNARNLISQVATLMPDYEFHFTNGNPGTGDDSQMPSPANNFHVYDYLPYDQYADRYSLAIHHAGTGVMYACLQRGIPALVWPQDYDQFDHAARLIHHGVAKPCRPNASKIATDLRMLTSQQQFRDRANHFRQIIDGYSTVDLVTSRIRLSLDVS